MNDVVLSSSTQLAEDVRPRHPRLLIVDDIDENLDLLEDVLLEQAYEIVRAHNGVEALEVLRTTTVDLIVADAMMPKMDGFELCKALRQQTSTKNIPFVIHSANYVDKEDEDFAHTIGADRYVVKDPALSSLKSAIEELLERTAEHMAGTPEVRIQKGRGPQKGSNDREFLEKHHSMVSKKLEEKMVELEMYADTLNRKNRELQSSEARYRSLFEYASVAIFVIDRQSGKVLDVNRMGMNLLRSTREDVLTLETFPFAERNEFLASLLESTKYIAGETAVRARDGEIIEVEIGAGPVAQANDLRQILFIRDITEQRKMQQQLVQAEKMMMMGCFATGIAHEIRNPLTAVALNLQYLLHKHGAQTDIREYVEAAFEATLRVGNVVENTLNLARRTPLSLKPEKVNTVVNEVLRFVRIPLQEKGIKLRFALDETVPLVELDAKEIKQALLNLLQNAIEVSSTGGEITISTLCRPSRRPDEKRAKVEIGVKDSGPGIRPEDIPHLFELLRTTKAGGTGIGLALSKHIMDRHRGEISLEPHPEGGTLARLIFTTTLENNGGTHV
jgi:PAS domain S-box-containing protein